MHCKDCPAIVYLPHVRCESCRAKLSVYIKERKARRTADKLCADCAKPTVGARYCNTCSGKRKRREKIRRRRAIYIAHAAEGNTHCFNCHEPYQLYDGVAYCAPCTNTPQKPIVRTANCPVCGLNFNYKCYARTHPHKYCSQPCRTRADTLGHKYGLKVEDWRHMVIRQQVACAICREAFQSLPDMCVDHCHETGHIRGILCNDCNSGIGFLRDDPKQLRAAAAYLEESRS